MCINICVLPAAERCIFKHFLLFLHVIAAEIRTQSSACSEQTHTNTHSTSPFFC